MFTTKVSVVKCADLPGNPSFIGSKFIRMDEDLVKIKATAKEAVEKAIGSPDAIIKEGQTVLIKPNIPFLAPLESFAVVDPRMIEAVVSRRLLNDRVLRNDLSCAFWRIGNIEILLIVPLVFRNLLLLFEL